MIQCVCNIADMKISRRIKLLAIAMTHLLVSLCTPPKKHVMACHGMSMTKILIQIELN